MWQLFQIDEEPAEKSKDHHHTRGKAQRYFRGRDKRGNHNAHADRADGQQYANSFTAKRDFFSRGKWIIISAKKPMFNDTNKGAPTRSYALTYIRTYIHKYVVKTEIDRHRERETSIHVSCTSIPT